jgi:hypothetical protein
MFAKGYTPWNKGLKGWCSPSGFKKGHIPWMKGKHHTEESKQKFRETRKGFKHSEETKNEIRIIAKQKGYGKWMLGKKASIESRIKIGLKEKGKNHWNWKGGITPLKHLIRESIEYTLWQEKVFERDNYTCQKCNKTNCCLNAHHKKEFAIILQEFLQQYSQFSPIEDKETLVRLSFTCTPFWDLDNGQTLCEDCHNKTKGRKILNK